MSYLCFCIQMSPKIDPACRGIGRGLRRPPSPDLANPLHSTPLEKTFASSAPRPAPEPEDWSSSEQVCLCTIFKAFYGI